MKYISTIIVSVIATKKDISVISNVKLRPNALKTSTS